MSVDSAPYEVDKRSEKNDGWSGNGSELEVWGVPSQAGGGQQLGNRRRGWIVGGISCCARATRSYTLPGNRLSLLAYSEWQVRRQW